MLPITVDFLFDGRNMLFRIGTCVEEKSASSQVLQANVFHG